MDKKKNFAWCFGFIFIILLSVFATFFCLKRNPDFGYKTEVRHYVETIAKNVPDGQNVWYIGDSYSNRDYVRKLTAETFGNIRINFQSGKRFAQDVENNPSGLSIVRDWMSAGKAPSYLIFELGTNDHGESSEDMLKHIEQLRILLGGDTSIILMTTNSPMFKDSCAGVNNAIRLAAERDDRIYIADWESETMGKENQYISSDNLHPSPNGHRLMIKLFQEELNRAVADRG